MALLKLFYGTLSELENHPVSDGSDYILTDSGREFIDIGSKRTEIFDQTMPDSILLNLLELQALVEDNLVVKATTNSYVQHPTLAKSIVLDSSATYDSSTKIIQINDED